MVADDLRFDSEQCEDGVILLKLGGYLDAHTFERLDQQIAKLFAANNHKLVVDLSQVDYISSAGAGVFIAALNDAHDRKGNVVLLNPTGNVRDVLDMLGFNQIFKICSDKAEAVKAACA